jgi:hypothetical protein
LDHGIRCCIHQESQLKSKACKTPHIIPHQRICSQGWEITAIKHTAVEPESDYESESSAEDIITESISLEITLESDSQGIES